MNTSTEEMLELDLDEVSEVCRSALTCFITPEPAAKEVFKQLLDAELRGKHSHGLVRIPWIYERLGEVSHRTPEGIQILPWFSRFECSKSIGYIAAREAQTKLLETLANHPFGVAVCANAFPTGVIGDYLRPLAESGRLAVGFATSPPLVTLPPGKSPLLGTNPICIALPSCEGHPPFVADVSPAPATFGQLLSMLYGFPGNLDQLDVTTRAGESPKSVEDLFDDRIRLTGKIVQQFETPPQRRQYALTLGIELLTTLLAGSNPRGSLVMAAIDPGQFEGLHPDAVTNKIEQIVQQTDWHAIPGAHGETSLRNSQDQGLISLPKKLWERLQRMAVMSN
ncbi:MAG: Ldh family oxidoreductase [Candidatus Thiodiazotropha lotti]|nr:Ldh family oxidoreductase [Candidatus Thiodiazotropha lotti]